MSIVDEKKLLTDEEHTAYEQLLKLHGFKPYHFLIEVTEDQNPLDMNDINYVIILKIKVTQVENNKSNTYFSQLGSRTWLDEWEEDLQIKYYVK